MRSFKIFMAIAIAMVFMFYITGCSDIPYTGPMLTVDDVDKYLSKTGGDTVCLQDGFDSVCLKVIEGPQGKRGTKGKSGRDGKDGINAPTYIQHIHHYNNRILHHFYNAEGELVVIASPIIEKPPPVVDTPVLVPVAPVVGTTPVAPVVGTTPVKPSDDPWIAKPVVPSEDVPPVVIDLPPVDVPPVEPDPEPRNPLITLLRFIEDNEGNNNTKGWAVLVYAEGGLDNTDISATVDTTGGTIDIPIIDFEDYGLGEFGFIVDGSDPIITLNIEGMDPYILNSQL